MVEIRRLGILFGVLFLVGGAVTAFDELTGRDLGRAMVLSLDEGGPPRKSTGPQDALRDAAQSFADAVVGADRAAVVEFVPPECGDQAARERITGVLTPVAGPEMLRLLVRDVAVTDSQGLVVYALQGAASRASWRAYDAFLSTPLRWEAVGGRWYPTVSGCRGSTTA